MTSLQASLVLLPPEPRALPLYQQQQPPVPQPLQQPASKASTHSPKPKADTLAQPPICSGQTLIPLTLPSVESERSYSHFHRAGTNQAESSKEFGVNTPGNQLKWDAT